MQSNRKGSALSTVSWSDQVVRQNIYKSCRKNISCLLLVCVLVLSNVGLTFAGWEDRECVVLSHPYLLSKVNPKSGRFNVQVSSEGILSGIRTAEQDGYELLNRSWPGVRYIQLFYYDLKEHKWIMRSRISVHGPATTATKSSLDKILTAFSYAKTFVSIASNIPWIAKQFPNGCSDIPGFSSELKFEATDDTGNPECNQIPVD